MRSADLKPYRKTLQHSYAIGTRAVLELLTLRSGDALLVLVHPKGERSQGVAEAVDRAAAAGIPVRHSDRLVAKLARKDNIYVVAAFRKYREGLAPHQDHVVLVQPGDFGNLGTILRTAVGFGVEDLALIEPAADDFHPQVVRASMGARFVVRVERFERFEGYRDRYPRSCYPFVSEAGTALPKVRFASPRTLVFGPEGAGLGADIVATGEAVTIPQRSRIDSFNVAVAVAVALYETSRR